MKYIIDRYGKRKFLDLEDQVIPIVGSYRHLQTVASSVWNIAHNLNFMPGGIYVEDSGGTQWHGKINHVDNKNLTIDFDNNSFAGFALLS